MNTMAGKVIHPEDVMPFVAPGCEDLYTSRMLIDALNSGSEKLQVNHGIVKPKLSDSDGF